MAPTDLMTKQWSRIYHIGKDSVPPLALCCSTVFGFLAYASKSSSKPHQSVIVLTSTLARKLDGRFGVSPTTLYTSAAVLAPCVAPYTFAVMWNGVQALEAKATGASDAPSATESEALVKTWSKQNLHRALIVGTAALLSAVATLS